MSGQNYLQGLFWGELTTLLRDARYVDLCLARTETIDRCIKGGLAIAASTSIAGWAVFKEYAFIWACVVATSQVIQAVKEYLPYKNRLKSLAPLSQELNALGLAAEDQWFQVSDGQLTEQQIHDLRIVLKRKKLAALKKAFPIAGLPVDKKLTKRADTEIEQYLGVYNVERLA
jgi:hypothetical protein